MTQVQNQPLAAADASLFAVPFANANGTAAFAATSATTPSDGIAGMRWPLPPRVLPDPTPGCPEPNPEPKPGSVAGIFDSLIDQLGAMLRNLLGGGSPEPNAPGPDRVPTGNRQM
jgi:hypothetical protein